MVQVIQEKRVKSARKEYECQACLFLTDLPDEMTFSEKRAIVLARRERWKIKVGQPYLKQFNIYDGDRYVFRAREDIHKICIKYDLYPEN